MAWKPIGYEVEVTTTATIPSLVVDNIVDDNYDPCASDGSRYLKIAAIKDLRYWWNDNFPSYGVLGLLDAKQIIEDGIERHARARH